MNGPLQAAIEWRINNQTTYRSVPTSKMPTDAWAYQEIICEQQPDVIVEIGNKHGGALLYLADLCETIGHGRLIGVDIDHSRIPAVVREHPRIMLLEGDALELFAEVEVFTDGERTMVIEDSAHTYAHTLDVMRAYGALVQPGGYMIVEDGLMPPVAAALEWFTAETELFVVDEEREWPITWNPRGFLRRVA